MLVSHRVSSCLLSVETQAQLPVNFIHSIGDPPVQPLAVRSMSFAESLKKYDSHSTVSKEFRVYTIQGAVLSVVTIIGASVRMILQQVLFEVPISPYHFFLLRFSHLLFNIDRDRIQLSDSHHGKGSCQCHFSYWFGC